MQNSCPEFSEKVMAINPAYLKTAGLQTLQINLGDSCNLSCSHCHHNASPNGSKAMSWPVMERIAAIFKESDNLILDITGGAPEIHPDFRRFIELTAKNGSKRIVRTNLAIIMEPGMEWLPEFYSEQNISLVASLPCYLEENVDNQRGNGVYNSSIDAIRQLNKRGYGKELELNLVYNPGGAFLPPPQKLLEADYKRELKDRHGIFFSSLLTITNLPVGRFRATLEQKGGLEKYLDLLKSRFNPCTTGAIMCHNLASIDWQGLVYNCDFNQAAALPVLKCDGKPLTVFELTRANFTGMNIRFRDYCFACTAGEGSSCSGTLA